MVVVQNLKFFHLFISGKIGQENAFHQHFRGHCWLQAMLQ